MIQGKKEILKIMGRYIPALMLLSLAFGAHAAEYPFDISKYDLGELEGGSDVEAVLLLKNITGRVIDIVSVEPSCGCTEAYFVKKRLQPSETGRLIIVIDTRGKIGRFTKTIDVYTNISPEPASLKVSGSVGHSEVSGVDPSVIFRGGCRECHVGRNVGVKQGEILYNAVCYVCHREPENLKTEEPVMLRNIILGGIKSTSMPGFSTASGGPLTEGQVSSLVSFIKTIRFKNQRNP